MILAISGKVNSGKDTVGNIIRGVISGFSNEEIVKYLAIEINDYLFYDNSNWKIKKFADKLKHIVCILLGCTRMDLENREFKEKDLGEEWKVWYLSFKHKTVNNNYIKVSDFLSTEEEALQLQKTNSLYSDTIVESRPLTPRLLMILIGTECGRNILHPDIWCNTLFSEYKQIIGYAPGGYYGTCGKCNKQFIGDKRAVRCEDCSIFYQNWIITDLRFPNELKAIKQRNGVTIRVNRPGNSESTHPSEIALDDYKDWDYVIDNDGDINSLIEKVRNILKDLNLI